MNNFLNRFVAQPQDNRKEGGVNHNNILVNKRRCPQNHPCPSVKVCPYGALTQQGFSAPIVDMDKCVGCGKCVKFCPMRALSLE